MAREREEIPKEFKDEAKSVASLEALLRQLDRKNLTYGEDYALAGTLANVIAGKDEAAKKQIYDAALSATPATRYHQVVSALEARAGPQADAYKNNYPAVISTIAGRINKDLAKSKTKLDAANVALKYLEPLITDAALGIDGKLTSEQAAELQRSAFSEKYRIDLGPHIHGDVDEAYKLAREMGAASFIKEKKDKKTGKTVGYEVNTEKLAKALEKDVVKGMALYAKASSN